jgi:hypothetical protein
VVKGEESSPLILKSRMKMKMSPTLKITTIETCK